MAEAGAGGGALAPREATRTPSRALDVVCEVCHRDLERLDARVARVLHFAHPLIHILHVVNAEVQKRERESSDETRRERDTARSQEFNDLLERVRELGELRQILLALLAENAHLSLCATPGRRCDSYVPVWSILPAGLLRVKRKYPRLAFLAGSALL